MKLKAISKFMTLQKLTGGQRSRPFYGSGKFKKGIKFLLNTNQSKYKLLHEFPGYISILLDYNVICELTKADFICNSKDFVLVWDFTTHIC